MFTSHALNEILKEAVSITLPVECCLCLRKYFVVKWLEFQIQGDLRRNADSVFHKFVLAGFSFFFFLNLLQFSVSP